MTHECLLGLPDGYRPSDQQLVGRWAAQLDDQLAQLKSSVEGLETSQLEWQPRPGRNTIGMLLAHIAVVEAWWLHVGCAGRWKTPEEDRVLREVTGLGASGDGLPAAPDAAHPESLRGWAVADYVALLDRTRAASHALLRTWSDADLDRTYALAGDRFSRAWTLYHLLEHLSAHLGQIRLLRRMQMEQAS